MCGAHPTRLQPPASGRWSVVGEIAVGEGAVVLDGGGVAGLGGLDLRVERAEIDAPAVVLDLGLPAVAAARDADVLGALAERAGVVAVVLRGADAQVVAAVVQAVAVDVIDDHAGRGLHNHAVHGDGAAVLAGGGVGPPACARGEPVVPVEPLVVGGVHHGELALGQRDVADAVVRGLGRRAPRRPALAQAEAAARAGRQDLAQLAGRVGVIDAEQQAGPARLDLPQPSARRRSSGVETFVTRPLCHTASFSRHLSPAVGPVGTGGGP